VREAAGDDYRFGALVLAIVRSAEFQEKAHWPTSGAQTVADARASPGSTERASSASAERASSTSTAGSN
jgi:hypothetical protein